VKKVSYSEKSVASNVSDSIVKRILFGTGFDQMKVICFSKGTVVIHFTGEVDI